MVKEKDSDEIDPHLLEKLKQSLPVPFTFIYSKLDGVVAWRHCIEDDHNEQTENVEVYASHFGMGLNLV